jgi:hypothetical protein
MTRISAGAGFPGVGYSHLANTVPRLCQLGENLPQNWNEYLNVLNNNQCFSLDLRFSEPVIRSNQVFLKLPNTNHEIGLAKLIGHINGKRIMQPIAGVDSRPIIIINLDPAAYERVLGGIKQLEATYGVMINIDTLQPAHDDYDQPPPEPGRRQVPTSVPIAKLI